MGRPRPRFDQPGAQAIVFLDAHSVDAKDLDEALEPFKDNVTVQFFCLLVPDGKTVQDCVAVVQVPRDEEMERLRDLDGELHFENNELRAENTRLKSEMERR